VNIVLKVLKDWLTGLDGTSFALGKAMAIVMFLVALPLPYVMLLMGKDISLTDAGVYLGGLGGAVMACIWGTNPAEPRSDTPAESRRD